MFGGQWSLSSYEFQGAGVGDCRGVRDSLGLLRRERCAVLNGQEISLSTEQCGS